jgi:tungstate transport system ATP-binding protein
MPMQPVFDLTDVDVHFGPVRRGVQALSGINLRVFPGERLALVGSNGCGKSTLLRVLHRLITPTAGRLTVASGP